MAGDGTRYFPLNCQLDEKFELIEAEFGLKGFAVIIKLFQRIYGEHGYYCEWNHDIALLFARKIGLSCSDASKRKNEEAGCGFSEMDNGGGYSVSGDGANFVHMVVNAAIKRGLFSKELFQRYGILTSRGIQKRYLEAARRRTKTSLCEEYLLIPADQISEKVDIFSKNVDRNSKNADSFKQRKGKERRGKERRGKERKGEEPAAASSALSEVASLFQQCGFQVTGYTAQVLPELVETYGSEWVMEAIRRAAERGKKSLAYLKGILNSWQMAGAMDRDTAGTRKKSAEGREAETYDLPY